VVRGMSAHTPGPWVSQEVDYGCMVRISSAPSAEVRFIVADVVVPDNARSGRSERPRFLADVALMKAAPDLLAELRNIAYADTSKWDADMRDQFREWAQSRARAAIAKVEGRTP
jgi:hypothetical protein